MPIIFNVLKNNFFFIVENLENGTETWEFAVFRRILITASDGVGSQKQRKIVEQFSKHSAFPNRDALR